MTMIIVKRVVHGNSTLSSWPISRARRVHKHVGKRSFSVVIFQWWSHNTISNLSRGWERGPQGVGHARLGRSKQVLTSNLISWLLASPLSSPSSPPPSEAESETGPRIFEGPGEHVHCTPLLTVSLTKHHTCQKYWITTPKMKSVGAHFIKS